MNYMSFFTIDVWTMIFTWVNMIILYNVMKKLLFKPVMNILNQRQAEIQKIYDDANEANEKAATLEKEYSEKMAQARDEAGEIIYARSLFAVGVPANEKVAAKFDMGRVPKEYAKMDILAAAAYKK